MRVLRTPPSLTYTNVTFPEGFTLEKMSQRLSAKLPTDGSDGVHDGGHRRLRSRSARTSPGSDSLEGLLFPDTYQHLRRRDAERTSLSGWST